MNKFIFIGLLATSVSTAAFAETGLRAHLNGDAEVPPVATVAGGTGEFTINDANTEIRYNLDLAEIENPTAAHIHIGKFGEAGPIIFNLSTEPFDEDLNGVINVTTFVPQAAQGINTPADALNAIRGGNTYVNVHTTKQPNGEIRGQLVIVP